jgi:hypothetical protein
MSGRVESNGLLDLPVELLFIIARHNYGDYEATRNACLVAKRMTPVFQEVLLEHVETISNTDGGIYKIINHVHDLAMAGQNNNFLLQNRIVRCATHITSLLISRQDPYSNAVHARAASAVANQPYAHMIRSLGGFSAAQKQRWIGDLFKGKDSALVRFLLWLASSIHTLEVTGTIAALPHTDFFKCSGALSNLCRLRISHLSQSKLSAACYHITVLPKLRELEFVGISLKSKGLDRLPDTPFQVKVLRLERSYISPRAAQRLITVCPQLTEFVYELGRGAWNAGQAGLRIYFDVDLIEQHLMMRSATLQRITIQNLRVARLAACRFSDLANFITLDYLCVNWFFLTWTNDADHRLLALPSILRELDLYHCRGDETLGALRYLLNHVQQLYPNLRVLRVRLRQTPTNKHLDNDPAVQVASRNLVRDYRSAGITLNITVITSNFTQRSGDFGFTIRPRYVTNGPRIV